MPAPAYNTLWGQQSYTYPAWGSMQNMYSGSGSANVSGSSGSETVSISVSGSTSNESVSISGSVSGNTGNPSATPSVSTSTSTSVGSEGVSGTDKNLPPYYALCYIMKT